MYDERVQYAVQASDRTVHAAAAWRHALRRHIADWELRGGGDGAVILGGLCTLCRLHAGREERVLTGTRLRRQAECIDLDATWDLIILQYFLFILFPLIYFSYHYKLIKIVNRFARSLYNLLPVYSWIQF